MEYVTGGRVRGGRLTVRRWQQLVEEFRRWRDCDVLITIQRAHATRSLPQNALYWSAYIAPLADYTGYGELEIHRLMKRLFLPAVQARTLAVCNAAGEVVLEEELPEDPTTTTLNTMQFSAYLDEITRFAAEHCDMVIPQRREGENSWK